MTLALLCVAGSVSAQDETDITTLPWVQKGQDCTQDFNNENGGTVYGTDAGGTNISYVDVSAYGIIKLYGAANQTARLFINREEAGDKGIFFVNLDAEGVATFDCNTVLTQQPQAQYIHLNGVKASAWNTTLNLSSITVSGSAIEFPEPDPFVLPDGEIEINSLPWVNQGQGCANNLGVNTTAPIYGTDAGPADDKLSYIDATNYSAVKLYGPDGTVRLFINRAEYNSGTFQFFVEIKDGVGTLDLANVYAEQDGATYIHINGVKASAPGANAQVNHITLVEKPFEFPEGVTDITTLPYANEGQDCVNNLGTSTDATIYGTDAGPSDGNLSYIDVTNYSAVKLYGAAGDVVRLFINRAEYGSGTFQFFVTIGEDGVGTLNLADVYAAQSGATYVHVNGFKAAQTWASTPDADGKALVKHIGVVNATTVPVTIGEAGYATFYSEKAVALESGMEAYAVEYTGSSAKLIPVEGAIDAYTPVILKADAADYELEIVESAASPAKNDLKVSYGNVTGDGTIYVLANGGKGVGFYKLAAEGTVPAGKCYLQADGAREFIGFGDATGIKSVETVKANGAVYNLAGQQVKNAQKGVFIVNGKKAVVK